MPISPTLMSGPTSRRYTPSISDATPMPRSFEANAQFKLLGDDLQKSAFTSEKQADEWRKRAAEEGK